MEIWLDTTDEQTIKKAHDLGLLYGVTTNPAILAQERAPFEEILYRLLDIQEGPVAVQVISDNTRKIITEAHKLNRFSARLYAKVPASHDGFLAMQNLIDDGVPVIATTVFTPSQAFVAFKLGAKYIAPYLGRIEANGTNIKDFLTSLKKMQIAYEFESKILAAGLKNLNQFQTAAEQGSDAATLPQNLFTELLATNSFTEQALEEFKKVASHSYSFC